MKIQAQDLHSVLKDLVPPRYAPDYVNFDGLRVWMGSHEIEVEVRAGDTPFSTVALPRKPFIDLLETLQGEVELSLVEAETHRKLLVKTGNFTGELYTASALEPRILTRPAQEVLRGKEGFLEALIKGLSLGKTLVEVEEERARIVSTDNYRLHIYTRPVEGRVEKNYPVPTQVKEALKGLEGPVNFHEVHDRNALVIEGQNGRVAFSLSGEQFHYQNALPTTPPQGVIVTERKPLSQALRRALVVADPRYYPVSLEAEGGHLKLQALDRDFTPVSEEALPGEGDYRVFINGRFLLKALEEITSDHVSIALHRTTTLAVELKDKGFYALIATLNHNP